MEKGSSSSTLGVVQAAVAAAFPPQRLVVGVAREAGNRHRVVGDARRAAEPRRGRHLDGHAGVAGAAPVVAARRRRPQPRLVLRQVLHLTRTQRTTVSFANVLYARQESGRMENVVLGGVVTDGLVRT